ncbi:unnamed protein product [Porites evermanni]|uniref:Uncharacterized protein n=1 Tax=Porites evermanni TaxID=104178 RepID=A0ABN8MU49_9CNID|nr:unnamed protein product [Porites evermanni]
MFRLLAVYLFVVFASNFKPSVQTNLVTLDSSKLNQKISELESRVQALTSGLNSARVHCDEKVTSWDLRSDAYIKYLDRQNVECPNGSFLARFRLVREGNYASARVRYLFRCCKFIL